MIELKPIAVLRAVSDLQSFSGAAKALGLAPASVTRIIAQLEQDLGAQLLVRTTRAVALTSAGASVLARYRPLLEGFEEVTRDLQRALRPDAGHLRLSAPVSLGVALLPRVMTGFRAAYPEITVEIRFSDTLIDVMQETCDLAIRVSGPPRDKSTIWRKLCEVPRRAVASPALLARVGVPTHPDDLPTDPIVQDINFSDIPILTVTLSGDYKLDELVQYAEDLRDEIEEIDEINEVEIGKSVV